MAGETQFQDTRQSGMAESPRPILVVGLGRSGQAAVEFLLRQGVPVMVTDRRPRKDLGRRVFDLERRGVQVEVGRHREATFLQARQIVVSPGIPLDLPPLDRARAQGIPVIGELELGFAHLEAPIIAVTGSNGKSTTTTLIGDMLERWGKEVFVGGNLGTPLCEYLLRGEPVDWVVLEVSSFQLETISRFRPWIGILLNLSPDHLDRHGTLEAYGAVKARLFQNQEPGDWAVLNWDDPWVRSLAPRIRSRVVGTSRKARVPGGVYVQEGWMVSEVPGGIPEPILPVSEFVLPGGHNLENALAAVAVGRLCGCPVSVIQQSLRTFAGLEHRMEFVRELQGIRFYNDSKATNVGATLRALESFSQPLIWIAGGRGKGADFTLLREGVRGRVRKGFLFGEAREALLEALEGIIPLEGVASLEEAVCRAYWEARRGDVVLLSPACSSLDQFRSFEERGNAFKRLVWDLPSVALADRNRTASW